MCGCERDFWGGRFLMKCVLLLAHPDECSCPCCTYICGGDGLVAKHVQFFAILWTVVHQAPLSTEFPRKEHWSGLPFPFPGDLPDPGMELTSSSLAGRYFTTEPPGKYTYFALMTHLKLTPWSSREFLSSSVCLGSDNLKLIQVFLVKLSCVCTAALRSQRRPSDKSILTDILQNICSQLLKNGQGHQTQGKSEKLS